MDIINLKSEEIREIFENKIDQYITERIYPNTHQYICEPMDRDLTDVMYHLVEPDWCLKSIHNRLWVLAIGCLICKLRGRLEFSDRDKKYFYLDKITNIAREVDWDICSHIAKDFLIRCAGWCAGYITLSCCVYKYAGSLAKIILNRLA